MKPPTAVIDTNIVVAGLLTADAGSPTSRILDGMRQGALPFLLSTALLAEYREVLLRAKIRKAHGLSEREIDLLLTEIATHAIVREPMRRPARQTPRTTTCGRSRGARPEVHWLRATWRSRVNRHRGQKSCPRDSSSKPFQASSGAMSIASLETERPGMATTPICAPSGYWLLPLLHVQLSLTRANASARAAGAASCGGAGSPGAAHSAFMYSITGANRSSHALRIR